MKKTALLIGVPVLGILLFSCAPKVVPVEKLKPPETRVQEVATAAKEPWQIDWAKALNEAKKEGKIVVFSALASETRALLGKSFKEKYNIDVEWVSGRGAEVAEKLLSERRAGIYLADLFIIGGIIPFVNLRPAGALDPLKPLLILPEVTDGKLWWEGGLWFVDNQRNMVSSPILTTAQYLLVNSNMVKKGEISSYRDLLNPKWKGKIVINDPTTVGAGARWFAVVAEKIMGIDYMRELAKQEVIVTRDQRLQLEWVSKEKYPITLGPHPDIAAEFRRANAPLMPVEVQEGSWVGGGTGLVTYVNRAPHPSAAKVFINWFHSREGQTLYSRSTLAQSARLDVPVDHLDISERRNDSVKYFISEDEDFIMKFPELMRLAGQIFSAGR